MEKNKGYLLPAGDAYTEDMACTLVYYPNKPEYRRALGGSLAYLATWIAWEKESEKKGIDAALSWKIALDLTMECWQMACLEELQSNVAAILAIMETGQTCCDEQDITDGDRYTDRVTDGVGDVPQNIIDAGYASGVGDWPGFDDYKCMIAHITVDTMEAKLREIHEITSEAGPVLGGVVALAAILGIIVGTGGLAIVFGIVAGVGAVSLLYFSLIEFGVVENLADKVATNHEELACAVYYSDGDEDALSDLNDKIDELFTAPEAIILKNMNNGPTLKALYAGRYDQQDIADALLNAGYDLGDFDCSCEIQVGQYLFTTTWDDIGDWEGWDHDTGDVLSSGNPDYAPALRYGLPQGEAYLVASYLALKFGLSNVSNRKYNIHRITCDLKHDAIENGTPRIGLRTNNTGAPWIWQNFSNVKVWTHIVDDWLVTPRPMDWNGGFQLESTGGTGGGYSRWDNVTIDFDTWLE